MTFYKVQLPVDHLSLPREGILCGIFCIVHPYSDMHNFSMQAYSYAHKNTRCKHVGTNQLSEHDAAIASQRRQMDYRVYQFVIYFSQNGQNVTY